jgi:hypothetical protein
MNVLPYRKRPPDPADRENSLPPATGAKTGQFQFSARHCQADRCQPDHCEPTSVKSVTCPPTRKLAGQRQFGEDPDRLFCAQGMPFANASQSQIVAKS